MKQIFFDENGILRSGWRAVVFAFLYILATAVLTAAAFIALTRLGVAMNGGSSLAITINALISLIPALLIGWLCQRYLDKIPYFSVLGASFSRGWWRHLLIGMAFGSAAVSLAVATAVVGGGLDLSADNAAGTAIASDLGTTFIVFAVAAAFEEALFRGYLLQTLARSGLAWLAILVTSVFFGLVHLSNPSADAVSTINTILAGLLFSFAYLRTRDLWLTWGIHLMWNWVQGSIFGVEVSGLKLAALPLLTETDRGPVWLTGGNYGIEGSIGCTLALAAAIAAIWYLPGLTPDPRIAALTEPQGDREATA